MSEVDKQLELQKGLMSDTAVRIVELTAALETAKAKYEGIKTTLGGLTFAKQEHDKAEAERKATAQKAVEEATARLKGNLASVPTE